MKTILKIAVGVALGLTVLIVGCAALVGGAATQASKDLDKQQQEHSVLDKDVKALPLGDTISEVKDYLGAPESTQEMHTNGLTERELYYNRANGSFGDQWQLSFENGKLTSKNRY